MQSIYSVSYNAMILEHINVLKESILYRKTQRFQ